MSSAEWLAVGREANLAVQQICSGVTALGHANHSKTGLYTQAFFGLSIGFERSAKLIIVADHLIDSGGQFPRDAELRAYGHDLSKLLARCGELSKKYRSGKKHSTIPDHEIARGIITTLSDFSRLTRYYNLDFLSGSKAAQPGDPITTWWDRVGAPILKAHLKKGKRDIIMANASAVADAFGASSAVLFHDEKGRPITDIKALFTRSAETNIVQTYGRVYTLQIVRPLAYLIEQQSRLAEEKKIEPLFGLYELFAQFRQDDAAFKRYKRWPIF